MCSCGETWGVPAPTFGVEPFAVAAATAASCTAAALPARARRAASSICASSFVGDGVSSVTEEATPPPGVVVCDLNDPACMVSKEVDRDEEVEHAD